MPQFKKKDIAISKALLKSFGVWFLTGCILIVLISYIPGLTYDNGDGTVTIVEEAAIPIAVLPILVAVLFGRRSYRKWKKREDSLQSAINEQNERDYQASQLQIEVEVLDEEISKTTDICRFFEDYSELLEKSSKLAAYDGKVTNIDGNIKIEHWKLQRDFQKHLHDAIERCSNAIIQDYRSIYKYDADYIKKKILYFKNGIDTNQNKIDKENTAFASAIFKYLCHECKQLHLLDGNDAETYIKEMTDGKEEAKESQLDISMADTMDGYKFETLCQWILMHNGFKNVTCTGKSGDQGVDIIAEKGGVYYAVQCKCYHSDLGNTPVQEVFAGKEMYQCQVGVVMTNRYFTAGAKELAAKTKVLLWDRDKLQEMMTAKKETT